MFNTNTSFAEEITNFLIKNGFTLVTIGETTLIPLKCLKNEKIAIFIGLNEGEKFIRIKENNNHKYKDIDFPPKMNTKTIIEKLTKIIAL